VDPEPSGNNQTGQNNLVPPTTEPPRKGGPLSGGLGIFVFVVLMSTAIFLTYRTLTTGEQSQPQGVPATFVCIETNQDFVYTMKSGEQWPVVSPYSKKKTGYPAEVCLWTKDGKQKRIPTYVVLNENLGKPGPTICPDCGKVVVGHNPAPPKETPFAEELPVSTSGPSKKPRAAAPPSP
jgi:hypothetical protein